MGIITNIAGGLFNKTLRIGFTIIALPTIMIIVVNLTNKILTNDLVNSLGVVLGYVDQIVGTKTTNYILIAFSVILITRIVRFFARFISGDVGNENK